MSTEHTSTDLEYVDRTLLSTWSTLCLAAQGHWNARRYLEAAAAEDQLADQRADGRDRPAPIYAERAAASHPDEIDVRDQSVLDFICANADLPEEYALPIFEADQDIDENDLVSGYIHEEPDQIHELFSFLDRTTPDTQFSSATLKELGDSGIWQKIVQTSQEAMSCLHPVPPALPPLLKTAFYARAHSASFPDDIDEDDARVLSRMDGSCLPDMRTIAAFKTLSEDGDLPVEGQLMDSTWETLTCVLTPLHSQGKSDKWGSAPPEESGLDTIGDMLDVYRESMPSSVVMMMPEMVNVVPEDQEESSWADVRVLYGQVLIMRAIATRGRSDVQCGPQGDLTTELRRNEVGRGLGVGSIGAGPEDSTASEQVSLSEAPVATVDNRVHEDVHTEGDVPSNDDLYSDP